jgi:hypothetical protein
VETLTQQPISGVLPMVHSSTSLAGRKRQYTKALQEAVESRKTNDKETASLASQLSLPLPPPEVAASKKTSKKGERKNKYAQFERPFSSDLKVSNASTHKRRGIISSVYIKLMKYLWNLLIPM